MMADNEELVERLRELLKGATARPWTAFDRDGVRAIMKGKEPRLKANGYHSRQWPEIVAWGGFDGSDVPERYRSANLHLIVGAVNALPDLLTRIEQLHKEVERLRGALQFYALERNWKSCTVYMCGHGAIHCNVMTDGGNKARAALTGEHNG